MEDEKIRGLKNPRLMEIKALGIRVFFPFHTCWESFLSCNLPSSHWNEDLFHPRLRSIFGSIEPDIVDESVLQLYVLRNICVSR